MEPLQLQVCFHSVAIVILEELCIRHQPTCRGHPAETDQMTSDDIATTAHIDIVIGLRILCI